MHYINDERAQELTEEYTKVRSIYMIKTDIPLWRFSQNNLAGFQAGRCGFELQAILFFDMTVHYYPYGVFKAIMMMS